MEERNLCESCWNSLECFQKGIFEREKCNEYKPLSMDELKNRTEFVNSIMVGPCPNCGKKETECCEHHTWVDDPTVGYCKDCNSYWCTECGFVFSSKDEKKICAHWSICEECSYQEEECPYIGNVYECPDIREDHG